MVSTICTLTDRHPGLVAVLACLADYYHALCNQLNPAHRDRLQVETAPVALTTERTEEEVFALVRKRLAVLDDEGAAAGTPDADGLFPFTREELVKLRGSRPRSILAECYAAWRRSRKTGGLPVIEKATREPEGSGPVRPVDSSDWPQRWNDFRTAWNGTVPKKAADLAEALAWGANVLAQQTSVELQAENAADLVHLKVAGHPCVVGICEGAAQGGKLASQIQSLKQTALDLGRPGIAVRSTEFAKTPKARVNTTLAELLKAGGRRVIFPEADWRTVLAWRAFAEQGQTGDGFAAWVHAARPLAEVQGLRELVEMEKLLATDGKDESDEPTGSGPTDNSPTKPCGESWPKPEPEPDLSAVLDPARIVIGHSLGLRPEPIPIGTASLTQHIAVLGGTGSGKTTTAMTLIEHLLLRGIPAILVDRKGDLARYGDPAARDEMPGSLGQLFREKIDVALYTPSNNDGRPLALSVLPARIPEATSHDLRTQAEDATQALASMLNYREGQAHAKLRAALLAAIQVLLEMGNEPPTLERLLELMDSEDPALLQALGYLDQKVLRKLVEDLDSFRQLNARILSAGAEPLAAERLLGLGLHAVLGKTRLSVISTKFLRDNESIQFWVAQLMMELARFGSVQPSRELQAVVMLDEADLYLPAVGKPASKQPVENGLRRFRSQGIGLVLATQSPGDFDYRCRENIQTWLVGRVKEARALEKLRPVFGPEGASRLEKLGQHATGEFCIVRSDMLKAFKADRNLLRTEQMSDAEILMAARNRRHL